MSAKKKKLPARYPADDEKPILIAQAQAMKEKGFAYMKIARFLNLDRKTVKRYCEEQNQQYEGELKIAIDKHYQKLDYELTSLADNAIRQHLIDEKKMGKTRLNELTGLYKTARELQKPATSTTNNSQTNIVITTDKDNFSITSQPKQ